MSDGRLAAIRDGVELPTEQARALWRAFSEHMERNQGDYDGFARAHGFSSVRTEHRRGVAVLYLGSTASLPPPPRRSVPPSAVSAARAPAPRKAQSRAGTTPRRAQKAR